VFARECALFMCARWRAAPRRRPNINVRTRTLAEKLQTPAANFSIKRRRIEFYFYLTTTTEFSAWPRFCTLLILNTARMKDAAKFFSSRLSAYKK
jgi:hypothetical protein